MKTKLTNLMTSDLEKVLDGIDLYLLNEYATVMNVEREESKQYNTDIMYYDNKADFYAWVDTLSWDELKTRIEKYKDLGQLKEYENKD